MKAGIVLDAWKLPIFVRHLDQCGYRYGSVSGPTPGTHLLTVFTENVEALTRVVQAANNEAALTGEAACPAPH